MMTNVGTKRIFISDIHMGDARSQDTSQAGCYPYGWFRFNILKLANFLTEQLNAPEVAEVVILGDLFDEWVIPTNQDPLTSFQDICDNPNNKPVIEPLKELAKEKILSYVPGNHDMALFTNDQDGNQTFMKKNFPGIRYHDNGVYCRGRLVAEHGHRYCLFNASDSWDNLPSLLPMGYFLSRMVAYKVSTTGIPEDYYDILINLIDLYKNYPNFVESLYEAFRKDAGLKKRSRIKMTGIGGFPATVGAIGSRYEHLIPYWKQNRPDIPWGLALSGEGLRNLSLAADYIYFSLFGSTQNIVIFGHTHVWDLKRHPFLAAAPKKQVIRFKLPCRAIYANCGTWIDSTPSCPRICTYVETREDAAAGRHYVRVLDFPDKNVLGHGYVNL